MKELAEAGLDSLNISLDTLDREGSLKITRRDLLDDTLAGIEEAMKYLDEFEHSYTTTLRKRKMIADHRHKKG